MYPHRAPGVRRCRDRRRCIHRGFRGSERYRPTHTRLDQGSAAMPNETEPTVDAFTTAYLRGTAAVAGSAPVDDGDADVALTPRARTTPADTIALGGHIITSTGAIRGWLVIQGGVITDISTHKPDGAM